MFENLSHAPFILGSYGIAFGVFFILGFASWRRSRKLEAKSETLKAQRPTRQRRRTQS